MMKASIYPRIGIVILLGLLIGGCSSNLMVKAGDGVVSAPQTGSATIVFMRSSFVAGAVGVELFEVNDGQLTFVGSLPNGSKIAHVTKPGEKVYMAYGSAADFMIAKVEGGKTYYSIVRPNWGTGGFAPTPVRTDGTTDYNTNIPEFQKWQDDTTLIVKKPEAETWFAANKERYQKIYESYWTKFQTKNEAQKLERTILPSDGM